MSNIKSLTYTGLILASVWMASSSWGQEGDVPGYIYKPVEPSMDFSSTYQWRPADAQVQPEVQTFKGGAELVPGLSQQSPIGLPPGTYRPTAELQTLSPQVGGFRFRSISPEEQSRYRATESQAVESQVNTDPNQMRFRGDGETPSIWSPDSKLKPRFRPDVRLSNKKSQQSFQSTPYPSYQYTAPTYSTPVFRQNSLDR